jgi:hypothetical protein
MRLCDKLNTDPPLPPLAANTTMHRCATQLISSIDTSFDSLLQSVILPTTSLSSPSLHLQHFHHESRALHKSALHHNRPGCWNYFRTVGRSRATINRFLVHIVSVPLPVSGPNGILWRERAFYRMRSACTRISLNGHCFSWERTSFVG